MPRDRPHGVVLTSEEPARTLDIVGPPSSDRQIAATGTLIPNRHASR
jgi:hypothetical protein